MLGYHLPDMFLGGRSICLYKYTKFSLTNCPRNSSYLYSLLYIYMCSCKIEINTPMGNDSANLTQLKWNHNDIPFVCLFVWWCLTLLQQYFSYIVAVSFICGANRRTRRKPLTCRKSLTNFIT